MITTKQKNTINIFKRLILVVMFFSLSYAQEINVISFQTGSLQTFVDVNRGNFSIFDKEQKDLDFVSLLFGGATHPNSYFTVTVDDTLQTVDQMQVKQPFKVTLGSQVDGTFYAGERRDVLVEVAYFSLDLINTGDFNSVGVILKLSNVAFDKRKIKVNFTLDTDIGESHDNFKILLPSGEILNTSHVFNHTPKFLFFSEGNIRENNINNKGFYLYPYVSDIFPSYMAVANWRTIFEQKEIKNGESFYYKDNLVKDIGMVMHYGDFYLEKNDIAYVGIVISKQQSIASPVLSEDSITKGVFNEDRFQIEALLNQNFNSGHQPTPPTNKPTRVRPLLPEYIPTDSMWGYLYRLNIDMSQSSSNIDSKLRPYTPSQTSNTLFQRR